MENYMDEIEIALTEVLKNSKNCVKILIFVPNQRCCAEYCSVFTSHTGW